MRRDMHKVLFVRMDARLLADLDAYADMLRKANPERPLSRSEVARQIIRDSIAQHPKPAEA